MELETLHRRIESMNRRRFVPRFPDDDLQADLVAEHEVRFLEDEAIERDRAAVSTRAATAPSDPTAFVRWFENLEVIGPGQHDALFPWLADHATLDQMRWFLRQEVAVEAHFDDLVALAQIRMPERAKLELARNYWDELGRGQPGAMHSAMLARLSYSLHLDDSTATPIVWEAAALANVTIGLATNRRYAYHALGALGAIELTAPGRAALINAGLKRLGVSSDARQYYALHSTLDQRHSQAWNREVFAPIIAADPRTARAIAEGALLRLEGARRCLERYRRELGVHRVRPITLRHARGA
jgi:hypothetical protein